MLEKDHIVEELGEHALLLPQLVTRGLAANDRVKYLFTLLQNARSQADHPEAELSDLRAERLASGVDDAGLDRVVAASRREGEGRYRIPGAAVVVGSVVEGVEEMLAPVRVADPEAGSGHAERLETLRAGLPGVDGDPGGDADGDLLPGAAIAAMTSGRRSEGDSLHLLVMDLHKELNRLQARISRENLDGARVYDLADEDRSRVRAFTAGLNATAPLKFDHPGLGTTATRSGPRLILQNDIGTTDAHVLVVHVEGLRATVTYTDLHLQRARFFQGLFDDYGVRWQDLRSRSVEGFEESDSYYLCLGNLEAGDDAELEGFLRHLGSRLVFLIDWNRARKRLRPFVKKRDAIALLRWAADHDHGHRGFLVLGGERLIYDAMELASTTPLRYGERLDQILGREAALDFLRFVLRTSAEGLLAGRSQRLIRDEVKVELGRSFQSAQQGLLGIAARIATLVFEIASRLHDGLLRAAEPPSAELRRRTAERAGRWESRADALVNEGRQLLRRAAGGELYRQLLEQADDAADALEEGAFLLGLLPAEGVAAAPLEPLQRLAGEVVEASQELVKCFHLAVQIQHGGAREDVQDFLEAVDRTFHLEHRTDDTQREVTRVLVAEATDFRQLHLLSRLAHNLEKAVDAMLRCALMLRDHLLSEGLGP